MGYLVGPGKRNEHSDPHILGGDLALMAWHDDNELGMAAAMGIARHIEAPRKAFGTEVPGGHIWHCSLSIGADEGQLTDEHWREISEEFLKRMGLDDNEGAKAPLRWVAVRHGLSSNGNDHIHLAVNLVREDGTRASIHHDYQHSQDIALDLEKLFGLKEKQGKEHGLATRGYHPAERQAQARAKARARYEQGLKHGEVTVPWKPIPKTEREALAATAMIADQPRFELARTVRGCSTASVDEAEFVRRLRRAGLILRPRLADGT
ncbi:relaxase/mobilization nuclease domain-containing protein [Arthrobacter halodurans]|uniref:Relaxase/mobilization nuclease domain-containing protein n=1 Tax=Arthrobacter halodurans TaxID=516699 RepID=A0ABV4UIR2_9MICC